MKMKRISLVLLAFFLVGALAVTSTFAACGAAATMFQSPTVGWLEYPTTDAYGTNYIGFITVMGCGSPTAGVGLDSGTYTAWTANASGKKLISGTWQNAGADGCLSTGTLADTSACGASAPKRATIVIVHKDNEGAANHSGTIWIASRIYAANADFGSLDRFGTAGTTRTWTVGVGAVMPTQALPSPTITTNGPPVTQVTLTWTGVDGVGYYLNADGQPASVITNYSIYTKVTTAGAGNAPTSGDASTWTFVQDVPYGTNTVTIPYSTPGAGNWRYYAIALKFADGMMLVPSGGGSTTWLGANAVALAPTAAPLFSASGAGLNKGTVTATWRSNVETGVASYQVFYAGKKNGNYKPIDSTVTAPKGNNSSYSVSFAKPVQAAKFFVKVKATMMDGQDQWADPVKVGANASTPELDD
jgi:hypothetical protein